MNNDPNEMALARIPQDEEAINIGFFAHKRAQRAAMAHLGQTWTPAHDKFVVRKLFRDGEISDYQKSILLERIHDKTMAARANNPSLGRYRLW